MKEINNLNVCYLVKFISYHYSLFDLTIYDLTKAKQYSRWRIRPRLYSYLARGFSQTVLVENIMFSGTMLARLHDVLLQCNHGELPWPRPPGI